MTDLPNTLVVVRWGDGEQIAQKLTVKTTSSHRFVRKWRKNSRRWTNALRIPASEILRYATEADIRRFKPEI